jgi:hypothetical protein
MIFQLVFENLYGYASLGMTRHPYTIQYLGGIRTELLVYDQQVGGVQYNRKHTEDEVDI